jgi:tetratricopeptide (TPR) repeat protein
VNPCLRLGACTSFLAAALCCSGIAPEIDTAGMEPPVRELIETRRNELNASPAAQSWGALGDALLAHGLDSDAVTCYAHAAELSDEPFEWLYLQALATAGTAAGVDVAVEPLRRALELQPDHALAELRLALLLQRASRHEEAVEWFELAVLHDPGLQRALRGLGQSRLALERYAAAIDALERAVVGDPGDAAGWSALAQTYAAAGRHARAGEAARWAKRGGERSGFQDPIWLQHVLQNGVSVSRRFERAQRALSAGDALAARSHVESILNFRPDDADAHYLLGSIEAASGNEPEAQEQLERALELNPDHVRALLDWAALAQRSGRMDEAHQRIERARMLTPGDPAIVLALAENRQRANDFDGALAAYERLVELLPESSGAWFNLGMFYERAQQRELAIRAYRRAISLDPDSPAVTRLEALER